jgi:filamin
MRLCFSIERILQVSASDVGNASKVVCSGAGVTQGETKVFNPFTIDTSHAGYGGVSVSVEGPSRALIECVENKDSKILMRWKPSEPGIYIVSVKFADHPVPGSPFTVKVVGEGVGLITERVTKTRNQSATANPGEKVELQLRVPDTNPFDMCAKLIDPEGHGEDISAMHMGDSVYLLKFTPKKPGLHAVSVTYREQHVAGTCSLSARVLLCRQSIFVHRW